MAKELHEKAQYKELTPEQQSKVELIRSTFSKVYDVLEINCQPSRELEIANQKLEEAQMWTIKSISRNS